VDEEVNQDKNGEADGMFFFAFWQQTDRRTNRWTAPMREAAVSLSRAAA